MHKIEVNCETGEVTEIELTAEEIVEAQAQKAAWDAEQAAKKPEPNLLQIIAELQAKVAALETQTADNPQQGETP
jgi:hypothetical protein